MLINIGFAGNDFESNEKKETLKLSASICKKKMEINRANDEGVSQKRHSSATGVTCTPVAKKTRRAKKQKQVEQSEDNDSVFEDDVVRDAPKTPRRLTLKVSETPRRSARKSVRPPLDYVDIIEKNLVASTSKERKESNTSDNEEQVDAKSKKWNAAEVGRHSSKGKRIRKSKRGTHKKNTAELEHITADESEEIEVEQNATEQVEITKPDPIEKPQVEDNEVEEKRISSKVIEELSETPSADIDVATCPETKQASAVIKHVDMEELGLCPLSGDEQVIENDEMPSLIVVDDGEPANELNRTFDADDKSDEDEPMPALRVTEERMIPEVPNLLDTDTEKKCSASKKWPVYHFPTPYKCKSKENFQFTGNASPTEFQLVASSNNLEVPKDRHRKRSKSISGLSESNVKTVSFHSPIETAHVQDIDKRWENLNNSNITQRRRRSKSLDEIRRQISRIPKPKPYPQIKPAITPSKTKTRTKLPNFAAIHQKQFEKMENLVEHIERKAVRAKVLSNSALKLEKSQQATIVSSAKKLPSNGEYGPSRAVKKIKMVNSVSTPHKAEELERKRRLPTPRKIVSVVQPKVASTASVTPLTTNILQKPAFNLSTKLFIPAPSTATSTKTNEKTKLEERRKRHMEMYKGRRELEKKGEYVRGVRSNRRFELQMQHRRQLDENLG